jgi:hypothetical protein
MERQIERVGLESCFNFLLWRPLFYNSYQLKSSKKSEFRHPEYKFPLYPLIHVDIIFGFNGKFPEFRHCFAIAKKIE